MNEKPLILASLLALPLDEQIRLICEGSEMPVELDIVDKRLIKLANALSVSIPYIGDSLEAIEKEAGCEEKEVDGSFVEIEEDVGLLEIEPDANFVEIVELFEDAVAGCPLDSCTWRYYLNSDHWINCRRRFSSWLLRNEKFRRVVPIPHNWDNYCNFFAGGTEPGMLPFPTIG